MFLENRQTSHRKNLQFNQKWNLNLKHPVRAYGGHRRRFFWLIYCTVIPLKPMHFKENDFWLVTWIHCSDHSVRAIALILHMTRQISLHRNYYAAYANSWTSHALRVFSRLWHYWPSWHYQGNPLNGYRLHLKFFLKTSAWRDVGIWQWKKCLLKLVASWEVLDLCHQQFVSAVYHITSCNQMVVEKMLLNRFSCEFVRFP